MDGEHPDEPAPVTGRRALFGTSTVPARDLAVLGGAVLLIVGYVPALTLAAWSPRWVVLLGFLPAGLVAVVTLCRRGDRGAWFAAAFVVVGLASALLAHNPRVALIGQLGKESSAVVLAMFVGWWALGRRLGTEGRRMLPAALVVGLGVQAAVGMLQAIAKPASGDLALLGGRATGLTANPVHLGALMAGGVALCSVLAATATSPTWWRWLGGVVLFGAAANVSGTRSALAGAVLVILWLGVTRRSWRAGAAALALVVGIGLGTLPGRSSVDRTDLGSDGRSTAWVYGLESFTDRPLLGHGPGGFRAATQHRFDAEFVKAAASDESNQAWFDAHNVGIEYLVTTGLLGVLVLAGFGWSNLRRARGPLAATFVAIGSTWLLQPLSVTTAPVALLALGAAIPFATDDVPAVGPRVAWTRRLAPVVAAVGAVLAIGQIAVDATLSSAIDEGDAAGLADAARWFPHDAVVADLVAQAYAGEYSAAGAAADDAKVLEWRRRAADDEPDRPLWWSRLGAAELVTGHPEDARVSLEHAIDLQPWSPTAWTLLIEVARVTDDADLAATAHDKVCAMGLPACDG